MLVRGCGQASVFQSAVRPVRRAIAAESPLSQLIDGSLLPDVAPCSLAGDKEHQDTDEEDQHDTEPRDQKCAVRMFHLHVLSWFNHGFLAWVSHRRPGIAGG